jgi:hypothetical protein
MNVNKRKLSNKTHLVTQQNISSAAYMEVTHLLGGIKQECY